MVQAEISEADTPTMWLGATPSGLISNSPPSSPSFLHRMPFLPQPSQFILAWKRHQICWLAYRVVVVNNNNTRMWASAQCDGRPAEYRWRPLFNAAKFGWCRLLECRAVTLPKCETRWNLQGCPKLANRSQLLRGQSSPYYQDMWGVGEVSMFNKFFPVVDTCLSCEDTARQSCAMVPKWWFLCPVFSPSRVQRAAQLRHAF